ncbi:MAG: sugar phosphate nucleotidyltransferase [Patescibacteria group bacterium]|nr:hypothetical protein [Patescibacteria group bacterium]
MKKALENLKKEIASFSVSKKLSDEKWKKIADNCVVALMAGGMSKRFSSVSGGENKNSFKLPNGDTMVEMIIRMYRDAGIKNFVALLFYKGEDIEKLLGDGSSLGVNISYSYDPEKPVGKGGAVRHALDNGSIPKDKYLIVHNPDDVIVEGSGEFPRIIVEGHMSGVEKGALATVVTVSETPHPYTGMKVKDGMVTQIEMYPIIPIPTHIGVTVFSPDVFPLFEELFDLSKKSDFEKVLFPVLSNRKQLFALEVPSNAWIAVNNPKSYEELLKVLGI